MPGVHASKLEKPSDAPGHWCPVQERLQSGGQLEMGHETLRHLEST